MRCEWRVVWLPPHARSRDVARRRNPCYRPPVRAPRRRCTRQRHTPLWCGVRPRRRGPSPRPRAQISCWTVSFEAAARSELSEPVATLTRDAPRRHSHRVAPRAGVPRRRARTHPPRRVSRALPAARRRTRRSSSPSRPARSTSCGGCVRRSRRLAPPCPPAALRLYIHRATPRWRITTARARPCWRWSRRRRSPRCSRSPPCALALTSTRCAPRTTTRRASSCCETARISWRTRPRPRRSADVGRGRGVRRGREPQRRA